MIKMMPKNFLHIAKYVILLFISLNTMTSIGYFTLVRQHDETENKLHTCNINISILVFITPN